MEIATQFAVGDKVTVNGVQVKDCVIVRIVKENKRRPGKTMYQVEYTLDDALARESSEVVRRQQPFFGEFLRKAA